MLRKTPCWEEYLMLGSDSRIYSNYYENPGQLVRSLNLTIFYILYPPPPYFSWGEKIGHFWNCNTVHGYVQSALKVWSKLNVLERTRTSRNNLAEKWKNKYEIGNFQYMSLLDVVNRFKIWKRYSNVISTTFRLDMIAIFKNIFKRIGILLRLTSSKPKILN